MQFKETKDGVNYYTKTYEDTFTKEDLEQAVKYNKEQFDTLKTKIMECEGNIALNESIVNIIKEKADLTEKEIAGAEIYFRNVYNLIQLKKKDLDWENKIKEVEEELFLCENVVIAEVVAETPVEIESPYVTPDKEDSTIG